MIVCPPTDAPPDSGGCPTGQAKGSVRWLARILARRPTPSRTGPLDTAPTPCPERRRPLPRVRVSGLLGSCLLLGLLFGLLPGLIAPVAAQAAPKAASIGTSPVAKAASSPQSSGPIQSPTPSENLGVLTHRELAAVQQPLFGTNGKLELGVQSGILPADVYVFSTSAGLQGTLHLNDRLGLELNGQYSWGFETYASRTLRTQGIRVDAWSPVALVTVDAVYAPIYAKLNLLSKRIVHFDVAVVGGGGLLISQRTLYNDVSAAADASRYGMPLSLNAGLLHRYYVHLFGQQVALRLDARDHLSLMQGLDGNFWLKHNLLLGLGVSTFLPARKGGGS